MGSFADSEATLATDHSKAAAAVLVFEEMRGANNQVRNAFENLHPLIYMGIDWSKGVGPRDRHRDTRAPLFPESIIG